MLTSKYLRVLGAGLLLITLGFFLGQSIERVAPTPRLAPSQCVIGTIQPVTPAPTVWHVEQSRDGGAIVVYTERSNPPVYQLAIASAPPRSNPIGFWLALALVSALAPITWAALTWKRTSSPDTTPNEDPIMETFVPRRDD